MRLADQPRYTRDGSTTAGLYMGVYDGLPHAYLRKRISQWTPGGLWE